MTAALDSFPRIELASLPTPLQYCQRLTDHLGGPRLLVKRDDLTGLGGGGNKVRKLEFVLADAVASGADTLVMSGVIQSNALRQAAAAAAVCGLDFHAIVITDRVPRDDPEYRTGGNALLTGLFGAVIHPCSVHDDREAVANGLADRLRDAGKHPYVIPYGASTDLGALGYVAAAQEIAQQIGGEKLDAIVHASGTGGTQAGLVVGSTRYLPGTHVVGIDIDAEPKRVASDVGRIAEELGDRLEWDELYAEFVEVVAGYAGPAYGSPTAEMLEAVTVFARLEGVILDPVYSGKGAAGLIGLIRSERFTAADSVVFLHTGGSPGLFAYRDVIAEHLDA